MLMAVSGVAVASDPGKTAVGFLEKVRAKTVDLHPGADTALARSTSEAKRDEIARRLDRMARDLGNDPLEVGKVKLDGDLAGVLVRKISGFDPNRMQVFPVALVKRDGKWLAAPVPASFENSGLGYGKPLRERLTALEDWLLRERVLDLATLREQCAARMRSRIEENLPAATLHKLDPVQVVERFLHACETRNPFEACGLLGGLSKDLPDDWPMRARAAEQALAAGPEVTGPWRALVSRDVLRVIVHREGDDHSALVSIGCLDPAGGVPNGSRPRVRLVHLDLSNSGDGLWRINLPGYFLQDEQGPDPAADEDLDMALLNAFAAKVRKQCPAAPKPTVGEARQAVIDALLHQRLPALVRLARLEEAPAEARERCVCAAELWWSIREPSSVRLPVPLGLHEEQDLAAASFQIFSARNPDRFDFKVLYFAKSDAGWLWIPKPESAVVEAFADWKTDQNERWRDAWQDQLLPDCPVLAKAPVDPAPSTESARQVVQCWLKAIRTGDIPAALRLSARLDLPDSKEALLRNLGYELIGALKNESAPTVTEVHRQGNWAAVGTKDASNGKAAFPLYSVVATPAGPRILPEVDLSEAGTRSRNFLNKASLKRLGSFSASAEKNLKTLFAKHQAEIVPP